MTHLYNMIKNAIQRREAYNFLMWFTITMTIANVALWGLYAITCHYIGLPMFF